MRYNRYIPLLIFSFLYCHIAHSQKIESELLWRISGKQLQQPSYLFGTIHIQDKKVFNFPDSLYTAIDNCSVFSLEINPDSCNVGLVEYMNTIIEKSEVRKNEKKLSELLNKSELKALQKKLDKAGDYKAGNLTFKQAYLLKEKLLTPEKQLDDMPTFMDAFLYKIARDKNKQIAGLESMNSQMSLLGDFSEKDENAKQLIKNIENKDKSISSLKSIYLSKDLDKIQDWVNVMPSSFEERLLSGRNKKMVIVMDSIMQFQNLFAAVGAAHLPGKNGLISLLRQSGYTVEPVICNTYTHANNYVFAKKEKPWVDVIDTVAGYLVKMPNMPSDVAIMGGIIQMKTYFDILNYQGYYTMHIANSDFTDKQQKDSLLDLMSEKMITNSSGINVKTKSIVNNGVEGKEYTFEGKQNLKYRIQLLTKDKDLFLLMTNGKKYEDSAITSFFHSFKLIPKTQLKWSEKTFSEDYISVKMPGNKPKASTTYDNDTTVRQDTYTASDASSGSYYFLILNKALKNYNYINDSIQIENLEKRMTDKVVHFERKSISTPTYQADDYEAVQAKGVMVRGRMIYRGNRVYHALVVYPDNANAKAEAMSYLKSIHLMPMPETPIKLYYAPDSAFKAYSFAPFELIAKKDTSTDIQSQPDKVFHYNSWDKERLINYDVFKKRLSNFYWNSNDTAMLKKWVEMNKSFTDSMSDIKYSFSGNLKMAQTIITNSKSAQKQLVKVIGQGRTRYTLTALLPPFAFDNKEIATIFEKFTILATDTASIQLNPLAFFEALHSSDSATFANAVSQEEQVYFSKKDLPYLLKEFPRTFALDSANYNEASSLLLNQIRVYANELSVKDIEDLYNQIPSARSMQKYAVLALFKDSKDSIAAFSKLKSLLINNPPTSGYSGNLLWALKERPTMAKTLFPELFKLTRDSINASLVCQLAKSLMDSGYLSKDSIKIQLPLLIENSIALRKNIKNQDISYYGVINFLAALDIPEVWNEIKQYQYVPDNYIRYTTVSALLDKKMQADRSIIDTLAANNTYRIDIYDTLKASNQVSLFPKKYLTQRYFAESHLNIDGDDSYEYSRFIGEKTAKYKNATLKFYLFEVKYNADDKESYLAIVGGYENNATTYSIKQENNLTGTYNTLPFDKKNIDNYFKNYLKEIEERDNDIIEERD